MTDRAGSWRQGFTSLSRLNLTQACERLDFFQSGRVQLTDFKTFQLVYVYIVYILFISYKMHMSYAAVKRFIVL